MDITYYISQNLLNRHLRTKDPESQREGRGMRQKWLMCLLYSPSASASVLLCYFHSVLSIMYLLLVLSLPYSVQTHEEPLSAVPCCNGASNQTSKVERIAACSASPKHFMITKAIPVRHMLEERVPMALVLWCHT